MIVAAKRFKRTLVDKVAYLVITEIFLLPVCTIADFVVVTVDLAGIDTYVVALLAIGFTLVFYVGEVWL